MAAMSDSEEKIVRRPWRTERLPPLVGATEACEILGVKKMTLHRWTQPGSGRGAATFGPDRTRMIPPARTSSGPVWVRSDVERYAVEYPRDRAVPERR